jgi:hypothetical protein
MTVNLGGEAGRRMICLRQLKLHNETLSQKEEEIQMASKHMKNIFGQNRKANQNNIKIPLHPSQNGYH